VADAHHHRSRRRLGAARLAHVARTLEDEAPAPCVLVILPAAAPTILTGMRISMGIAWLVIVAAESAGRWHGHRGIFVWNEWNNLNSRT